jgi:hypothetical protein
MGATFTIVAVWMGATFTLVASHGCHVSLYDFRAREFLDPGVEVVEMCSVAGLVE